VHLEAPEVLTVPRSAVIETGPEAVAYVDEGDGMYARRVLKLGRRGDDLVEVAGGLQPGDKVVVNGNLLIDGQAEMNRAFAGPAGFSPEAGESPGTLPALTEAQRATVGDLLTLADDLAAALAYDDLEGFNGHAARTHSATPALLGAFEEETPWRMLVQPFLLAGHLMNAEDLESARASFHPFSNAVVAFAKSLRRSEKGFASLKVFRCPMTKDAFAGAPDRAEWMQLQGPVRNPYFGAEMLDCGSEVKS
jgi:Cu(I)/Ag(I) efflux system membrane fusion protein